MATRAKYTRAKANDETSEPKLDTDILMRFSPTYGKFSLTQASMSHAHSLSFSQRPRPLSPSRLLKNLWIRLYG